MTDLLTVRRLVGPADPLRDVPTSTGTSAQAQGVLAAIVAAPRSSVVAARQVGADRRPWLLTAAAGVVALLVAGAVVIGPGAGSPPAVAATPPVLPYASASGTPAGDVLRQIAATADALPAARPAGRYRYVRTQGWNLNSATAGGRVTSVLASTQTETWRLPDGSGRTRTTSGENLVNRVGSQQTLQAALTKPASRDEYLPSPSYTPPPLLDLDQLPYDDATALAMAIERDTNDQIPAGAHLAAAVAHLFAEQPVPPSVRAKLWRLLATLPGMTHRGDLTDRVGRKGTAVTLDDDGSAHGLPQQYLFIIEPATGQLLEFDNVLTIDPGALNVPIPAILSLTVYLQHGYTHTGETRPAQ